jgi:uncharacterized protein YukE
MADTNVDYQGVADGANQLRNVKQSLNDTTQQLRQRIRNLVSGGGFATDTGSSALEQAVGRFEQANTKALQALDKMAQYLDSVPGLYQQADSETRSIYDRYQPG